MTAVRKNFAMLFALQISTYVVPLVTLPLGMKRVFSTILISSGLLNVTILPEIA